jgi:hypothetical protein
MAKVLPWRDVETDHGVLTNMLDRTAKFFDLKLDEPHLF